MCLLLEYYLGPDYPVPDEVKAETNNYLNDNDPIKEFCEEFIHKDSKAVLLKKDIKAHYKLHFKKSYNERDFFNAIEIELGQEFQRKKKLNGNRYIDCIIGYKFGEELEDEIIIDDEFDCGTKPGHRNKYINPDTNEIK